MLFCRQLPITLSYTFFNQHELINDHIKLWKQHTAIIDYIIVDDFSEKIINLNHKRLRTFRVDEDIKWNVAGARNLAFENAMTEWVFMCDFDHFLDNSALKKIASINFNNGDVFTFQRNTHKPNTRTNILVRKYIWSKVGGYDEDFSGNYGYEDVFFFNRLKQIKARIINTNILLKYKEFKENVQKDSLHNFELINKKNKELNCNSYKENSIIRFKWHEIK